MNKDIKQEKRIEKYLYQLKRRPDSLQEKTDELREKNKILSTIIENEIDTLNGGEVYFDGKKHGRFIEYLMERKKNELLRSNNARIVDVTSILR